MSDTVEGTPGLLFGRCQTPRRPCLDSRGGLGDGLGARDGDGDARARVRDLRGSAVGEPSARVAERALLVGLRPMLMPSRSRTRPEVGYAGLALALLPGGRRRRGQRRSRLARDLCATSAPASPSWTAGGSGPSSSSSRGTTRRTSMSSRALTRDLYVAIGEEGFWQGPSVTRALLSSRRRRRRGRPRALHGRDPLRRRRGRAAHGDAVRDDRLRRRGLDRRRASPLVRRHARLRARR